MVSFSEEPGHALNAFLVGEQTVYVDVIGGDKVAYLEVGKDYGVIALDVASDSDFSYSYLEDYAMRVEACLQDVDDYNAEMADYNYCVTHHEPPPPESEYDSLGEWLQGLNDWLAAINAEKAELGIEGTYWNPTGSLAGVDDPAVVSFYVHW